MSKKQLEKVNVLSNELSYVKNYMKGRTSLPLPPPGGRMKNTHDSILYRKRGNYMYKSDIHNEYMHEQIWRTYTQSIALAPNKSEELACGYGNRSALLFHLEKFKDCIKDCDKALKITKSDMLRTKLLVRKADCLFLSNKPAADVAKEALESLEKLQLDDEAAESYDIKLKNIVSNCKSKECDEKSHNKTLRKKYIDQLSNFPRSEEVPCASKSVAIKYNKKWGRHIVATEDIRPGDIIAIEKNYHTYISREGMYLYCSNCAKSAWSSIPCEHCIFDVYCSKTCRAEAWEKYHKWECTVFPHLWDIDENVEVCLFVMRFTFTSLSKVGGIENMKKLLIELDECDDPRTKGFLNGVYHDDWVRSIYSLSYHIDDPFIENEFTKEFCIDAYLLAKHTTFFGQKMDMPVSEIFKNKDVLFFVALLLHSHHVSHYNLQHLSFLRNNKAAQYATTVRAFSSLFNHECDPNINLFTSKHNTTVIYATKPIEKGTQVVCSYMTFLENPKEFRQETLKKIYKFTCKCLACRENWSSVGLPKLAVMHKLTPELCLTMKDILDNMTKVKTIKSEKEIVYSPKFMRDIVYFLESLAEKVTTHCDVYYDCLPWLEKMFWDVFGSFHSTIPENCFTH